MLHVSWLKETICQQVHLVGGKAANLAKLTNQFCDPPGFQEIIVTARWRLGESIVGRMVTPDTVIINADSALRRPTQIINSQIADKTTMTVRSAGGTQAVHMPTRLRTQSAVGPIEVFEVAHLALDGKPILFIP